jgi:hypothetical protein
MCNWHFTMHFIWHIMKDELYVEMLFHFHEQVTYNLGVLNSLILTVYLNS